MRNFCKITLLILSAILFLGCSTKYEITIPIFSQKSYEIKKDGANALLFVSSQNNSMRFVYQTPIGTPIARKIFKDGVFLNDGFLPPNRGVDEFFVGIIKMIENGKKNEIITLENGEKYEVKEIDIS